MSKMAYNYTPAYYSTLHDSITSLCKTILPFSFKKKRLPSAEQRLSKLQSDNLKWQQDSFHQILNLMGLHKEGILSEAEVRAFRTRLLDTMIASPLELEQSVILRDKLLFLQELLHSKCISEKEYHSSKRPLLQRLAVQGAEIEARDLIVANTKDSKENREEEEEEEWSVIDLKDDKENTLHSKSKPKNISKMNQIKGAASVFGFGSSQKTSKNRSDKSIFDVGSKESETKSILMQEETFPTEPDKAKRKPFKTLFQREQREGHGGGGGGGGGGGDNGSGLEEKASKSAKKQWGFDGFKKWRKNDSEDEIAPLPLNERSDSEAFTGSCHVVSCPIREGPDTKQIKKKLLANGAPSDFFIDKVVGDKIKKELSRIQAELSTTNSNLEFSNDQIDAISTTLPVDKADLRKFFPKSWCDRYGEVVLDVVKKEFKDHVGEMENMRNVTREKNKNNSMRWTTFEDDNENCHPNLFDHSPESAFFQDQNPFWNQRQ